MNDGVAVRAPRILDVARRRSRSEKLARASGRCRRDSGHYLKLTGQVSDLAYAFFLNRAQRSLNQVPSLQHVVYPATAVA